MNKSFVVVISLFLMSLFAYSLYQQNNVEKYVLRNGWEETLAQCLNTVQNQFGIAHCTSDPQCSQQLQAASQCIVNNREPTTLLQAKFIFNQCYAPYQNHILVEYKAAQDPCYNPPNIPPPSFLKQSDDIPDQMYKCLQDTIQKNYSKFQQFEQIETFEQSSECLSNIFAEMFDGGDIKNAISHCVGDYEWFGEEMKNCFEK